MHPRITAALIAVATVSALTACGGDDNDDETPNSTEAPAPVTTSGEPGPTQLTTPERTRGMDEQDVRNTLDHFIPAWASYSPWDAGNTKATYFQKWRNMATDDYGMQQYRSFDANWSWTWNTKTKAYGAKVQNIGDIVIDEDTAVARGVTVTRHLLPVLGTLSDDKVETKVYDITLTVGEDSFPRVSNVVSRHAPAGDK